MAGKAAAMRWLAAHVGNEIATKQIHPDGIVWEKDNRTLSRAGDVFRLDGSRVEITSNHVVHEADDRLRIEWLDSDGVTISWTTYTPVVESDDDSDDDGAAEDSVATVTLSIENTYGGRTIMTYPVVTVPLPVPDDEDEYDEWVDENIHQHTGTGKGEGDASYDVKITESTAPELIGMTFSFGY